jgi:hypothetical protein
LFIAEWFYFTDILDEGLKHSDYPKGNVIGNQDGGGTEFRLSSHVSKQLSDLTALGSTKGEPGAAGIDKLLGRKTVKVPLQQQVASNVVESNRSNGNGVDLIAFTIDVGNDRHVGTAVLTLIQAGRRSLW